MKHNIGVYGTAAMRPAIRAGEPMAFFRKWRDEFKRRGLTDIQASLAARSITDTFRKARYARQDFNAAAQERVASGLVHAALVGGHIR